MPAPGGRFHWPEKSGNFPKSTIWAPAIDAENAVNAVPSAAVKTRLWNRIVILRCLSGLETILHGGSVAQFGSGEERDFVGWVEAHQRVHARLKTRYDALFLARIAETHH